MNREIERSVIDNFVVIEGLDGSGTTTLSALLEDRIKTTGKACVRTCEPTDGVVGRLIRTVLKHEQSVTPDTLARLFTADRSEHLFGPDGIVDSAARNAVVLCDRYLFSSLAYQSIGSPFEEVFALNELFPIPEMTIFVDVPPQICAARRAERDGVELFEHDEIQDTIVANYHRAFELYRSFGADIRSIDGTGSAASVAENAWNEMRELPIFK